MYHMNESNSDNFKSRWMLLPRNVVVGNGVINDIGNVCNALKLMEMDIIKKELESRATSVIERKMHRRKKYMVDGVEIELVKPIDNSVFCANCNRLRVTCDGKLKPCLLRNDNLVDVSHASDSELEALFYQAMKNREPFYKGQPQEVNI